ncbi:MAG TPA: hypothetical protein VLT10_00235 [Verrucomicrobiae bacterium]|nr:hypothetical protein [Verrucomicrobiae bacterium]
MKVISSMAVVLFMASLVSPAYSQQVDCNKEPPNQVIKCEQGVIITSLFGNGLNPLQGELTYDQAHYVNTISSIVTNASVIIFGIVVIVIIVLMIKKRINSKVSDQQLDEKKYYDEKRFNLLDIIAELQMTRSGDFQRIDSVKRAILEGRSVIPTEIRYIKEKYRELELVKKQKINETSKQENQ